MVGGGFIHFVNLHNSCHSFTPFLSCRFFEFCAFALERDKLRHVNMRGFVNMVMARIFSLDNTEREQDRRSHNKPLFRLYRDSPIILDHDST